MAEKKSISFTHWILGAALVVIGVSMVAAIVILNSQADSSSTSATIANAVPSIVDVFVTTGADYTQSDNTGGAGGTLSLIAGGTAMYKITGTAEDLNGRTDITSVAAVLYRSSLTAGCTPDNNGCYAVSCTTVNGSTGDQVDYNCPVALQFYTDSTSTGGVASAEDWVVSVKVTDNDAANATNNSLHKEVETRLALSIPGTIPYGSLSLGQTTTNANNVQMDLQQYGNDEADVEVSSAGPMGCTVAGAIPVANQKWVLTDVGYSDGSAVALSGTPADTDINIGYRTNDGAPLTKSLFWNIAIPTSGVEGVCTGTNTVTTIAH